MAEKRMFSKTIIDSDAFLEMPASSQSLYFHLAMRADDEGFINSPRKIQRMANCNDDDLKLLIAKRFILSFASGIVAIKHWKIHNSIQKDRFKATVYQDERALIKVKENGAYTMLNPLPDCEQLVNIVCASCLSETKEQSKTTKDPFIDDYALIINYLNEKAGTNFKITSEQTKKCIGARRKENYQLVDFYKVIDNKILDWKGTDMQKFLRPQTLFGTKFESYLNGKIFQRKQVSAYHSDNVVEQLKQKYGGVNNG